MIKESNNQLLNAWQNEINKLPGDSRKALANMLSLMRQDSLKKAQYSWKKNKGPMALYWKVVGVTAGHLSRAIRNIKTK